MNVFTDKTLIRTILEQAAGAIREWATGLGGRHLTREAIAQYRTQTTP